MNGMKQEVVVMSATKYSMVSQETGELLEGVTVRYVMNNDLVPYEENDFKGYKLAKASLAIGKFVCFPEVPGVYEADMSVNISAKDGKATISAYDFEFKRPLTPKMGK